MNTAHHVALWLSGALTPASIPSPSFNDLHIELTGNPSRYAPEISYKTPMSPAQICAAVGGDEIPHLGDAPEKTEEQKKPAKAKATKPDAEAA